MSQNILGLLGLIPIYLGIKVAIYDDCEGEKRAKKELNEKGLSKLVGTVAIVTIASCGADNIISTTTCYRNNCNRTN